MAPQRIEILETTLRDGNYLVDFQFTAADTAWLCRQLEACGLRMIEIGHGLGMGASNQLKRAAATDEEYVRAAKNALKNAQCGMFAIPGIATLEDLRRAADNGLDFVRIGSNVDRVHEMENFIAEARKLGLFVCTNFMKSYCLQPEELGVIGAQAESFGSQMNYVVDSAGGMLPHEVRDYFGALSEATQIPMGFHGHDNIRLAIANSLEAVECGAQFVDTTLFGIGRGSGNAATELIAALFKRRFSALDEVDDVRLTRLAERDAAPLLHTRHQESISISLGLAQVHSMYLEKIVHRAEVEDLDIHRYIRHVGEVSRLTVDDDILDQASAAMRSQPVTPDFERGGLLELPKANSLEERVAAAENLADKLGLPCEIRVTNDADGQAISVNRTSRSVEIHVDSHPERILQLLKSDEVSVVNSPETSGRSTSVASSEELAPDSDAAHSTQPALHSDDSSESVSELKISSH